MNRWALVIATLFSAFFCSVFAESHHPQEFLKQVSGNKDEGEQIYKHFCANCHNPNPLIPLGAPRIGEQGDWKIRLKQGFEVLFKHSSEGYNAMPPRGGCFECTDQQLVSAILFMIPKKDQKVLINELNAHNKIIK